MFLYVHAPGNPVDLIQKTLNLEKCEQSWFCVIRKCIFHRITYQNPLISSLGKLFMPNLSLVPLAFEIPKNVNAISWKSLLIRNALYLLYEAKNKIVIQIEEWLSYEFWNNIVITFVAYSFFRISATSPCNHHMLLHTSIHVYSKNMYCYHISCY